MIETWTGRSNSMVFGSTARGELPPDRRIDGRISGALPPARPPQQRCAPRKQRFRRRTHTVRRGETWLSIATLYTTPNGVPASILAALLREQSMLAGHTQPWEPPKHGAVLAIPN